MLLNFSSFQFLFAFPALALKQFRVLDLDLSQVASSLIMAAILFRKNSFTSTSLKDSSEQRFASYVSRSFNSFCSVPGNRNRTTFNSTPTLTQFTFNQYSCGFSTCHQHIAIQILVNVCYRVPSDLIKRISRVHELH